jgi:hypothetical protein
VSDDIVIRIKTLLEKASDAELKKVEQDIQSKLKPKVTPVLDTTTYRQEIDKLVHQYKMKETTDRQFLDSMEKLRGKTEFTNLSFKKQEEIVRLLTQAERTYQRVVDQGTNINKARVAEAEKLANAMGNVREKSEQRVKNNNVKDLQKQTDAQNKALEDYHSEKEKKEQVARDLARKLTYEENQEKLKTTTATQDEIERVIRNSNENITEQQSRLDKVNHYNQEQMWSKLLNENKVYSRDNIKASVQGIEKENNLIREQIALYQKELAIKNQNLKTTYGTHYDSEGMSSILGRANSLDVNDFKTVNDLKKVTKQLDLETAKTTAGMRTLRRESTLALKEADGLFTTFGKDIFKLGIWAAAASAIYAPIRQLRSAIQFVIDLDNAMNQLQIVMNLSNEQAIELGRNYNTLAKEMSVTTTEIAKAAVEFARQGLSLEQMDDRLRNTIKYAKISGMEFQEAAEIITASVNSMGVETQRAIDIFSYMGKTFVAPLYSNV